MKKIAILTFCLLSVLSCKDDDKLFEPQKESELGGLIRFADSPRPATIAANDPSSFVFSKLIEDPNNNVVQYSLAVQNASGEYIDLGVSLTSFPTDLVITSEMLETALQVDASTFFFGQTFNFRGTLTNQAGIVYSGETQAFDASTETITGGNTDLTNIGDLSNNYRDALQFPLTIACPAITDTSTFAGTYSVVSHTYANFGFPSETGIQVISGPESNQVTIVNGIYSALGSEDLILNIDLNLGTTTIASASAGVAAWSIPSLSATYVTGGGSGLALECASPQVIGFNLQTNCCLDNIVVLQKE